MDYLDPKKQFRHLLTLYVGYVCIGIAIVIGTIILLYQAYGFGLKNGTVIQNGLVFFASQPHPANIYINNQLYKSRTNTRAVLPAGIYHIKLSANGYRTWQRTIELDGGSVQHFDYPFLFPTKLGASPISAYNAAPELASQSPDRRWLVVGQPGSMLNFDLYDLKNPTKAPTLLALPSSLLSAATSGESWQSVQWADDNQHLLLQHLYDGKTEYVLLDRNNPEQSVNLNQVLTLAASPSKLTLINKKYDQYYLFDAASGQLRTASLKTPAPTSILDHVLAFESYASDTLLYVTDSGAPSGKVSLKLSSGGQTYNMHNFSAGTSYVLGLTKYSGTVYVAAGAASENKVYIYNDPVAQLSSQPTQAPVPAQVLHVDQPDYLSFSPNAQFIVAEHANHFGVYDNENANGYIYTNTLPLDAPQAHASWMDGDRLTYISGGKLAVFDYDGTNVQTLVPATAQYTVFFAPDYAYLYDLAPGSAAGQVQLDQTLLLLK